MTVWTSSSEVTTLSAPLACASPLVVQTNPSHRSNAMSASSESWQRNKGRQLSLCLRICHQLTLRDKYMEDSDYDPEWQPSYEDSQRVSESAGTVTALDTLLLSVAVVSSQRVHERRSHATHSRGWGE